MPGEKLPEYQFKEESEGALAFGGPLPGSMSVAPHPEDPEVLCRYIARNSCPKTWSSYVDPGLAKVEGKDPDKSSLEMFGMLPDSTADLWGDVIGCPMSRCHIFGSLPPPDTWNSWGCDFGMPRMPTGCSPPPCPPRRTACPPEPCPPPRSACPPPPCSPPRELCQPKMMDCNPCGAGRGDLTGPMGANYGRGPSGYSGHSFQGSCLPRTQEPYWAGGDHSASTLRNLNQTMSRAHAARTRAAGQNCDAPTMQQLQRQILSDVATSEAMLREIGQQLDKLGVHSAPGSAMPPWRC